MSKHTPGTWKIDLDSTKYTMRPFVYAGSGDDRVVICELPAVMVFDTSSEMFVAAEDDDEIESNGRLIRAAPELLDLLEKMDCERTERDGAAWLTNPLCLRIREVCDRIK